MANASAQWKDYSDKFVKLSQREQILLLMTGLILSFILVFNFWLEGNLASIKINQQSNAQLVTKNQSMNNSIGLLEAALQENPNISVQQKIAQYQQKLTLVDEQLLALTSTLIDPLQMRYALMSLLKVEKGVSILSFELIGAKPLLMLNNDKTETDSATDNGKDQTIDNATSSESGNNSSMVNTASQSTQVKVLANGDESKPALGLYRHGIKLKLKGNYFALRDYLQQLEGLSWQFFWKDFHYKLMEYPNSELEIEIYSLSTKRVFIGV